MDPTTTLEEIRAILRTHRLGQPGDLGPLPDLWEALDHWLTGGGFLPNQWTCPTEDDASLHYGLALPVLNLTATVAELRKQDLSDPDRWVTLLAGLDRWITVDSSILPDQWLTVPR
ncbi:hypothetical protein ABTZ99_09335 [Actinosynnema sp. NPDC002837]